MLFSSITFLWFFLPFVFIVYRIIPKCLKNAFLLCASLLFYAWGEPNYIFLMISSITVNYVLAIVIDKCKQKNTFWNGRNVTLILAIMFNVGLLWYFKYFTNFSATVNKIFSREVFSAVEIMLPLGISFYTFQILSYVIDVHQNKCEVQKNYLHLALYISFFPQLVAGPIVKYKDVATQIVQREISLQQTAVGIKRFIYGLSKKVILSNGIAAVADSILATSYDTIDTYWLWIGVGLYTLQIYYDFSGYSDMAIGLGKMFGFEFMENFNYPYVSQSIQEFWRRWHISLSTWFKEYVYIPLGGNRKGQWKTYRNLLIVFAVTGIWHGASLNFLMWGLFHGFFLLLERMVLGKWLDKNPCKLINHIYTMFVVVIGWAMFRCDSIKEALKLVYHMFKWEYHGFYCWYDFFSIRSILIIVIAILLIGFIQEKIGKVKEVLFSTEHLHIVEFIWQLCLLTICVLLLVGGQYNPFIYFKF